MSIAFRERHLDINRVGRLQPGPEMLAGDVFVEIVATRWRSQTAGEAVRWRHQHVVFVVVILGGHLVCVFLLGSSLRNRSLVSYKSTSAHFLEFICNHDHDTIYNQLLKENIPSLGKLQTQLVLGFAEGHLIAG